MVGNPTSATLANTSDGRAAESPAQDLDGQRDLETSNSVNPALIPDARCPMPDSRSPQPAARSQARRSVVEHVLGEVGLGALDPQIRGALVGHGQKAPDPPRDGVLGQRRRREGAQLLQARLAVVDA